MKLAMDRSEDPIPCDNDRISDLPDGILASILSCLGLNEAARTSILSRRWRGQWAFMNRLNLDIEIDNVEFDRETKSRIYAKWVNHVLKSNKSPVLEEFRIRFDLVNEWKIYIDDWIMYALAKKVQILELDLSFGVNYTFPFDTKNPPESSYLYRLREIYLICVHVTGEALEYFLSVCPLLERLIVGSSDLLKNLRLNASSSSSSSSQLALKYLKIHNCHKIETLDICNAVNLVCFEYSGVLSDNLRFMNVPSLVELHVSCSNFTNVGDYLFPKLSCCYHQLETLCFSVPDHEEFKRFNSPPLFGGLKKLILTSKTSEDISVLGYMSLLDSCPRLQKFMFEVEWYAGELTIEERKVKTLIRGKKHICLEDVEVAGYYGRKCELELVVNLIKNTVALKRIIVRPKDQAKRRVPMKNQLAQEAYARKRAERDLDGIVPKHIELIIF